MMTQHVHAARSAKVDRHDFGSWSTVDLAQPGHVAADGTYNHETKITLFLNPDNLGVYRALAEALLAEAARIEAHTTLPEAVTDPPSALAAV